MQYFMYSLTKLCQFKRCGEKDNLDMLIKKAVTPKEVNHKGQGLWVTLKKIQGDLRQVHKEYPHIMSSTTAISRKMGFPDVIMPGILLMPHRAKLHLSLPSSGRNNRKLLPQGMYAMIYTSHYYKESSTKLPQKLPSATLK